VSAFSAPPRSRSAVILAAATPAFALTLVLGWGEVLLEAVQHKLPPGQNLLSLLTITPITAAAVAVATFPLTLSTLLLLGLPTRGLLRRVGITGLLPLALAWTVLGAACGCGLLLVIPQAYVTQRDTAALSGAGGLLTALTFHWFSRPLSPEHAARAWKLSYKARAVFAFLFAGYVPSYLIIVGFMLLGYLLHPSMTMSLPDVILGGLGLAVVGCIISVPLTLIYGLTVHYALRKLGHTTLRSYILAGAAAGAYGGLGYASSVHSSPVLFMELLFALSGAASALTFWLIARPDESPLTPPR
jgi:hypothetical protein